MSSALEFYTRRQTRQREARGCYLACSYCERSSTKGGFVAVCFVVCCFPLLNQRLNGAVEGALVGKNHIFLRSSNLRGSNELATNAGRASGTVEPPKYPNVMDNTGAK